MYNIGFTGHRDLTPDSIITVFSKIVSVLTPYLKNGEVDCYTGGAIGFDTIAANAVLYLKRANQPIKLHLLLPFPQKNTSTASDTQKQFQYILENADSVTFAGERYLPGIYHLRDRMIVDRSDIIIAYLIRNKGGTAYTVNIAKQQDKELINLAEFT